MFNETFGINKWLPFDVSWQSTTIVAMFSLILVNLWLGYPYMFLVSTGALQSMPSDLKEAAFVDGATGWKAFRKITFPLLLDLREPAARRQLRLQLQQLHADLAAHQRQPARHRRERRDDRHPAVVDLPRRPRRQPTAPGARRRPVRGHLPDRRRASRRSGSSTPRPTRRCGDHRRRTRRRHLLGRQVSRRRNGDALRTRRRTSVSAGARSGGGSARPGGVTSSACWPCSSPSSRCGSSSSPRSPRAPR